MFQLYLLNIMKFYVGKLILVKIKDVIRNFICIIINKYIDWKYSINIKKIIVICLKIV